MKNDKVIYTAIFGGRDAINDSHVRTEGWDYVLFTDNPELRSDFWDVRVVQSEHDDPARAHKPYKLLPHIHLPEYKKSIWVDANLQLNSLSDFDCLRCDVAMFEHPYRDCIYEEAEFCSYLNLDNEETINRHVDFLRDCGYPRNNGLNCGGFIYRDHKKCVKVYNMCFALTKAFSKRDQLSMMFSLWVNGMKYTEIIGSLLDNKYFKIKPHAK